MFNILVRIRYSLLLLALCVLTSCIVAQRPGQVTLGAASSVALDLDKPEDNLTAFVKMRASLKAGEETVYYWKGIIYSYIPGERGLPLFELEAYNVARIVPVEGGYQMLTREVALYKDLKTGEILEKWYNPFIQDTVNVVHVWNDPVNQQYLLKGRFGDWGVPWMRMGDGRIAMYSDIFLLYPSPLKREAFPENSRSDLYQASELFQFFINEADLNDASKQHVYSEVGWTRISDFLPWMRMGDRPGHLIYHCRGYKLMDGTFDALPAQVKAYVREHQPQFMHAPDTFESPNMTSWRYFLETQTDQKN
ncbi:MAG TPA: DUF1838 family protein [Saprospiraceae bacterium]|nr:DUF1838 family protein [Saprospiraceae bacterium]HMP22914.1 DUF1838 family protein [Saprospiraceae bacterium]